MLFPVVPHAPISAASCAAGIELAPLVQVCHEETLGDYASFTNIQEGTPELGGQLFCDFRMEN